MGTTPWIGQGRGCHLQGMAMLLLAVVATVAEMGLLGTEEAAGQQEPEGGGQQGE